MKIAIFGASGFVGSNFIKNSNKYKFVNFTRCEIENSNYYLDKDIHTVLNFVGKAHDIYDTYNGRDYYEINTKFCIDLFSKFLKSDAPQSLANAGFVRNHLSGDVEKIF